MNVHIHHFDDHAMLRECVASVREVLGDVPIHVLDGRYAHFRGSHDLTPGTEVWARDKSNVHYHAPLPVRLPFGYDIDTDAKYRPGGHAKARWAFKRVLPPDEWTLKLDTDERLQSFGMDLDDLDRREKCCPVVNEVGGDRIQIARLFVPQYWTPWVDDCFLPREVFPRDHPIECLHRVWTDDEYTLCRYINRVETRAIEIDNHGAERPAEYHERRIDHLDAIGREDRFKELAQRHR